VVNIALIHIGREQAEHVLMTIDNPEQGHTSHAMQTINHIGIRLGICEFKKRTRCCTYREDSDDNRQL